MRAIDKTAAEAQRRWGSTGPLRLISHRENAVFEASVAGKSAALRLHRPGYNSVPEIEAELWWTGKLAEAGFPVPQPILTEDGQQVVRTGDGLVATMVSWVGGAVLSMEADGAPDTYRALGGVLARLHDLSDGLDLPDGFTRRSWDIEGLLGPDPLWGRFWAHPVLTEAETHLLEAARKRVRARMEHFAPEADFGLIHADAIRENVLKQGDQLTLIDFDDAGFGFRLYDLAVAISPGFEMGAYPVLKEALVEGYSANRPISEASIALLDAFVMLRSFASLGWCAPRIPPDDPGTDRFRRRALRAAQAFVDSETGVDFL